MKVKSLVAPKQMRRRKMDAAVTAKVGKNFGGVA